MNERANSTAIDVVLSIIIFLFVATVVWKDLLFPLSSKATYLLLWRLLLLVANIVYHAAQVDTKTIVSVPTIRAATLMQL